MQRTITKHGVDFEVEFKEDGTVDAIYIGAVDVSDVLCESTRRALINEVMVNGADWFAEYHVAMAASEQQHMRRAA